MMLARCDSVHQSLLHGVTRQCRYVVDADPAHYLGAMEFHGFGTNAERSGGLLGRLARRDQSQYLNLPGRQAVNCAVLIGVQPILDLWRKIAFASKDGVKGGTQLVQYEIFEQIARSPGMQGLLDDLFPGDGGQYEDFDLGQGCVNLARGFNAIDFRHMDVQNNHFGLQSTHSLQCRAPICALGYDFILRQGIEQGTHALAHQQMIICKDNPRFFHPLSHHQPDRAPIVTQSC